VSRSVTIKETFGDDDVLKVRATARGCTVYVSKDVTGIYPDPYIHLTITEVQAMLCKMVELAEEEGD